MERRNLTHLNLHQEFSEKRLYYRNRTTQLLKHFAAHPEEYWDDSLNELVGFTINYENYCTDWIRCSLLYGRNFERFAELFLYHAKSPKFLRNGCSSYNFNSLSKYYVAKAALRLLTERNLETALLRSASRCYYKYLEKNDYQDDELGIARELESESAFSILLPERICNLAQGIDDSRIISALEEKQRSPERIWDCTWDLVYCLVKGHPEKINATWRSLVDEWKNCYLLANFFSFRDSYLVFLYFLVCENVAEKQFSFEGLSREILTDLSLR